MLEELTQIINFCQTKSEIYKCCALMPCCYLKAEESFDKIIDSIKGLPGLLMNKAELIAKNSSDYQRVGDLKWLYTFDKGWLYNWAYSQRNPDGKMSILKEEDFENIAKFFKYNIL